MSITSKICSCPYAAIVPIVTTTIIAGSSDLSSTALWGVLFMSITSKICSCPYAAIVPIVTTTIIAVLLALYPNFIITTITLGSNSWTIEVNSIGYIVFAVPFVAYFFAAMCVDLWRRLHYSSGMWVRRLYYMSGIAATSIPGFVFDLVLPFYGEYRWIWIGPLASVIFLGTTLYSMARFRMLHVKSFLVQAVTYASLIVTLAACYGAAFFEPAATPGCCSATRWNCCGACRRWMSASSSKPFTI